MLRAYINDVTGWSILTIVHQWGGLTPTPDTFRDKHIGLDIYGDGAHMILAPVSQTHMMWAYVRHCSGLLGDEATHVSFVG